MQRKPRDFWWSDGPRDLLLRSVVGEVSTREVARRLGVSPEAVRLQRSRLMRELSIAVAARAASDVVLELGLDDETVTGVRKVLDLSGTPLQGAESS